ncbi:hypothetical protein CDD83_7615 [Cordyceps sp. RAO-2017]|nr:hypothetical protein CDD83_7615 [Cordyceps sp. RAO-2017]
MMKQTAQRDGFTCSFCHGLWAGAARVLGRSARLACGPCHDAILDLSICWVCGEMVLRGDECVSFGWCFWHRACFGCLLCGSPRVCTALPGERGEGEGEGEGGEATRDDAAPGSAAASPSPGPEVTEPPLCAACLVEVEADGLGREGVVRKGLRRIGAVDGGLTQRRWFWKRSRRTSQASRCDGPPAVIWVDIHDPVDGPSFRPSLLKPVPGFMLRPTLMGVSSGHWHVESLSSAADTGAAIVHERIVSPP